MAALKTATFVAAIALSLLTSGEQTHANAPATADWQSICANRDAPMQQSAELAASCTEQSRLARHGATATSGLADRLALGALHFAARAQSAAHIAPAAYQLGLAIDERGTADPMEVKATLISAACERSANSLRPDSGALPTARAAFACAAQHATEAGDPQLASLSLLARARSQNDTTLRSIDLAAAAAALRNFQPTAETTNDRAVIAERIAALAAQIGDTATVQNILDASAAHGLPTATREGLRGQLAQRSGDAARATEHYQAAIRLETRAPELAQWQMLLARTSDTPDERNLLNAFNTITVARDTLAADGRDPVTDESNFASRLRGVYEGISDGVLRLAELNDGSPEARQHYLHLARRVLEDYREAEIQSVFGNECVPGSSQLELADLRPDEILLYPVVLGDRVALITARGAGDGTPEYSLESVRSVQTSVPADVRAHLTSLVWRVRTAIQRGWPEDEWEEDAKQLYQWLIAPAQTEIAQMPDGVMPTLVIVPDGPLRGLPLAALRDERGRYLIESARIAVAPSMRYSQPGESARSRRNARALAASLSRQVDIPALGASFVALTNTSAEAQVAAQPGAHRDNFTVAQLNADLRNQRFDILHLATHASFEGRTNRSYIVAADGVIGMSDLREQIARGRARGNALDLLVLSACETAVGDDSASMGFAGAAVQAGATSALASLWRVDDAGTRDLMAAFYADYRGGRGKAEALRSAQDQMRAQNHHPRQWAAFTLIGGWR